MNWGQLKAAVAAYTHRADLAAMFPTFLELAEQRIYIGEMNAPKIRVAAMRQFAALADGVRPTGFLEAIKLAEHDKPDATLSYRSIDQMPRHCRAYSWDGAELVLSEDLAFPVDMTYYARLATPAVDADTNWILANAPAVYLSSMLVEVYRWTFNDAAAAKEAANYASAASALNSQEKAAKISGSPLAIQRRGY